MRVDLEAPKPETVEEAVRVIRAGGIVLYPTDTIYGLGCDPFNEAALRRLFALKGRTRRKGVLLLVSGIEWVARLAVVPSVGSELMDRFWPGPLTLLFEPSANAPRGVLGKDRKIGIRCPRNTFLERWLEKLDAPIVSTSANLSGRPSPRTLPRIQELFEGKVDLLLEAGEPARSSPSTVVDLEDPPRIVRAGARAREVEELLTEITARTPKLED